MRIIPYAYVFDGSSLTDGTNPSRLSVPMREDGVFQLRKIAGLPLLASSARLYYPTARNDSQSNVLFRTGSAVFLQPQITYRRPETILFDLGAVARSTIVCGTPIYQSHLCFQGVRDLPSEQVALPQGKPEPFVWTYTLTLDWYHYSAGSNQNPVQYRQFKIDEYDFELQRIRIANSNGSPLTANDFALQFFDEGQYELSNRTMLAASFLNNAADPQTVWPSVPLIYHRNSIIRFAVQSYLCNGVGLPRTYQIAFEGRIFT